MPSNTYYILDLVCAIDDTNGITNMLVYNDCIQSLTEFHIWARNVTPSANVTNENLKLASSMIHAM
jgi:hypothetical protein